MAVCWQDGNANCVECVLCTIVEKSSAPLSLGSDNLKRFFDIRVNMPLFRDEPKYNDSYICIDEPLLLVHLKKWQYL